MKNLNNCHVHAITTSGASASALLTSGGERRRRRQSIMICLVATLHYFYCSSGAATATSTIAEFAPAFVGSCSSSSVARQQHNLISNKSSRFVSTAWENKERSSTITRLDMSSESDDNSAAKDEAQILLERVRKMREEIANLEGRTLEEVETEANDKRQQEKLREETRQKERVEREASRMTSSSVPGEVLRGSMLNVPITAKDQILQAATAVERAHKDGITRQIVRFALMKDSETIFEREYQWPGGPQQMYREAAGPLTTQLLKEIRAPTQIQTKENDVDYQTLVKQSPNVTSQIVWDFDGSAVVKADAASGSQDNIQAFVFPNTDNKYTKDIEAMDQEMGRDKLFLLINPFWRNIDSWGINLLAPRGKQMAQNIIFDECQFQETYVLLQFSVRGEECIALKVYPHKWQLFAFGEEEYYPYEPKIIRLGETEDEPKNVDFTNLLNEREEFKLSRNMRQLERMNRK